MKQKLVIAVAIVFLATGAFAGTISWSLTGNGTGAGITASGTLTTGIEYTPGVYAVTAFTGTFSDPNNIISGAITDPFTANGSEQTSSDGLYYYDNMVYSAYPVFDSSAGMLFNVNGGPSVSGGAEVNIAGDGGSGYYVWETTTDNTYLPGNGAGYEAQFSAATPEPATLSLVGLALLGLGIGARKLKAHKQ